jgi:hypothetical protein
MKANPLTTIAKPESISGSEGCVAAQASTIKPAISTSVPKLASTPSLMRPEMGRTMPPCTRASVNPMNA